MWEANKLGRCSKRSKRRVCKPHLLYTKRATAVLRFLLAAMSRKRLSVANDYGVRKNRGGKLSRFRLVPVDESRLNSRKEVHDIAFDESRKARPVRRRFWPQARAASPQRGCSSSLSRARLFSWPLKSHRWTPPRGRDVRCETGRENHPASTAPSKHTFTSYICKRDKFGERSMRDLRSRNSSDNVSKDCLMSYCSKTSATPR